MKCISCGKEIPNKNVYCPICGKEAQLISDKIVLEDDLLKVLLETEGNEAEFLAYEEEQRLLAEREQRRKYLLEEKKRKSKMIKLLICFILVVFAVIVLVVFGVKKNNSFDAIYEKAELAYHTAKYEDAIEYTVKALDKNPESQEAYLLLGDIYVEMEDLEQAESCYMKVIDMNGENITAYEKLLRMYQKADDYAAIETLYTTVSASNETLIHLFEDYLVGVPVIEIPSGDYEDVVSVAISGDVGLKIYYTLDGTTPGADKTEYTGPIKLEKEGTYVLQAVCVDEKGNVSSLAEATYILDFLIPEMPQVTPDGGTFTTKSKVSIYAEDGTTVYYTWDDSTPSTKSSKYTGPITIPEGNHVLSVIAIDDSTGKASEVFKTNFIYYPEVVGEGEQ